MAPSPESNDSRDGIAIVGMAFRFPGDLARRDALWRALMEGRDLVTQIPAERWATDTLQHDRRDEAGRSITFAAGVLSGIDRFDPGFFGISPREAQNLDPQQRLALELAWRAFEDAGVPSSTLAGSDCGVYLGISGLDYGMRSLDDLSTMDAHFMTGNTLSVAANRLSYVFDLHGPSLAVDTACSSSLVALHHACESLRRGESTSALVGGVNLLLHPYSFVGFTRASMLSAGGRSRAFAHEGDGYVRAEGGAMLLLKPVAQAMAEGDRIHAVIRATGNNTDGARKNGLTIPSGEAQAELLRTLLDRAGLQADDIDYVEAHGTGTAVGDPVEAGALGHALGQARTGEPLPIGSIKSNLGHMESASGMAGLVKAVLTLQHAEVPPSIHADTLNPALELERNRLEVVRRPMRLSASGRPLRAGVNSFGFGGANAHVLLEAAPQSGAEALPVTATPPPLFLSTRSPATLGPLAAAYHEQLAREPETLTAVAWNAAHRREWLEHRCAVHAETTEALLERLDAFARDPEAPDRPGVVREQALDAAGARTAGDPPGIGLVYSGNGCQWAGMGRALLEASDEFARAMDELEPLIRQHGGFSLLDELRADAASSRLEDTAVAQPLIFAMQVGLTRVLATHGIEPRATLGHSVGEVAAAWAAGIYTLEQAAQLVCERSRAQAATRGQGRMMAVNLDAESLQRERTALGLEQAWIELAATNAPAQLTLAGDETALRRLADHLEAKGIFNRLLDLEYAFHSRAMDPIRDDLTGRLQDLAPRRGSCPFISTVTGAELEGRQLTAHYWWRNVREPVDFEHATRALLAAGCRVLVEVGPDAILNRYLTQTLQADGARARVLPLVRRQADGPEAVADCAHRVHLLAGPASARARLPASAPFMDLPFTPFQRERFWTPPTPESYGLIQRRRIHPLLGYPLKEVAHGWENPLDTTVLPYLADHRVGGAAIMPAAGFVEMALAAAVEAFGLEAVDIESLEVRQALVFEPDQGRLIRLILEEEDGRFVIRSKPRLSEADWVEHAVGRVLGSPTRPVSAEAAPAPDTPALDTERAELDAATHYARARRVGLEYGPAFQGIARIEQAGRSRVAHFALPPSVAEDRDHHCHPGVLDLCFQSLLSHPALDALAERGLTMLPVGVGRLLWRGAPGSERSAPAAGCRAEVVRQGPQSLVADFVLFDAAGATLALLERCRFRLAAVARSSRETPHWRLETVPVAGTTAPRWPAVQTWEQGLHPALERLTEDPEHQTFLAEGRPLLDALLAAAAFEAWQGAFGDAPVPPADLAARARDDLALDWLYWLADQLVAQGWLARTHDDPEGDAWERTAEEAPPPAGTIWRSLMAEYPGLSPELILLGRLGRWFPALFDGTAPASTEQGLRGIVADSPHGTLLREASASVAGRDALARAAVDGMLAELEPGTPLRILQVGGHWLDLADHLAQHPAGRGADLTLTSPHADDREPMQARHARDSRVTLAELDPETGTLDGPAHAVFDLILLLEDGAGASAPRSLASRLQTLMAPGGRWLVTGVSGAMYWQALRAAATGAPPGSTGSENASLDAALPGFRMLARVGESDSDPQTAFALLAGAGAADEPTGAAATAMAGPALVGRYAVVAAEPHPDACTSFPVAALVEHLAAAGATAEPQTLEHLARTGDIPGADEWVIAFPRCDAQAAPDSDGLARLLELCNRLAAVEPAPRLTWLLPGGAGHDVPADQDARHSDAWNTAVWAFGRVVMNEYPDLDLHLIDPGPAFSRPDPALLHALARPDAEREVVLRDGVREALRLEEARDPLRPALPEERFELRFDLPGQLRNLAWQRVAPRDPGPHEVEVAVRAVGLNFRDVMYALGLLGDEIIEDGFSGPSLGLEFSGVVTRTGAQVTDVAPGDPVLGFGPQCFASHVITHAGAVHRKPEAWSFAEAATVPTVFFTAWYALMELARLQPGERVLIHGAAGGVGLAAIALAHQLGAEVFATAGTPEKREVLAMMGVEHIHDSRSLDFADEILRDMGGAGVDVVLNSLAGEAINRNLKVLKPFGRFLELGKRDFVENTRVGLRPFRNNLSYFGIDADQLMSVRPDLAARVFGELMTWMESHAIGPLPHRRFAADRVVEAFRYMQQSRQIGKIVVSLDPPPRLPAPQTSGAFAVRSEAAYLVTGGLSGFGLATARWLLERGAGEVVLVGRRGPQTPELEARLASLEEWRDRVTVQACDVSRRDQVAQLLERVEASGRPLRGIFHAATILDDALLPNLDRERLAHVMAAKAEGAWHLHTLTPDCPLDAFVLFGSVTTWLGNPGQANYVAANGYLEGLAQTRRAAGLPATCMNWGPIGDVGMLADNEAVRSGLEARLGGAALSAEQAIAELEAALDRDRSGEAVSPLDWHALARALPLASLPLFDRLKRRAGPTRQDDGDIREQLQDLDEEEARALIGQSIAEEVAEVLGLSVERMDRQRSLFDMGMDSLMGVELSLALEKRLGLRIPTMALSEATSIEALAERLWKDLGADDTGESRSEDATERMARELAGQHEVDLDETMLNALVHNSRARDAS